MKVLEMQWGRVEDSADTSVIIEVKIVDDNGNFYFITDNQYLEYDDFYVAEESLFDYFMKDDFEYIEEVAIEVCDMEEGRMYLDGIQSEFLKIYILLHSIMGDYYELEASETGTAEEYIQPFLEIEF